MVPRRFERTHSAIAYSFPLPPAPPPPPPPPPPASRPFRAVGEELVAHAEDERVVVETGVLRCVGEGMGVEHLEEVARLPRWPAHTHDQERFGYPFGAGGPAQQLPHFGGKISVCEEVRV